MDRELWSILSRQKGEAINWEALSREFNVTVPQLLRQSAALYEAKLQELQTQMRKHGNNLTNLKILTNNTELNDIEASFDPLQDERNLAAIQKSYYDALKFENTDPTIEMTSSHELETFIKSIPPESCLVRLQTNYDVDRVPVFGLKQKNREIIKYESESEYHSIDEDEEISDELLNERLAGLQIGMPSDPQGIVNNLPLKEDATPEQEPGRLLDPEPENAYLSEDSSFSDLSDSSVTQSALEDAYLSKFNPLNLSMVSKKSQFLSSLLK
ncbi:hypothetical protein K7432_013060 [Basidiobolus ranarum]